MYIDLLKNESLVASLDSDKVILTNQRLQLISGDNQRIIQLSQISFIEIEIKYNYFTLVAAVIILFAGFTIEGATVFGIFLFLILMALYIFAPSKSVLVRSSGGTIAHRVTGIRNTDIQRFIFLVQQQMAKAN